MMVLTALVRWKCPIKDVTECTQFGGHQRFATLPAYRIRSFGVPCSPAHIHGIDNPLLTSQS